MQQYVKHKIFPFQTKLSSQKHSERTLYVTYLSRIWFRLYAIIVQYSGKTYSFNQRYGKKPRLVINKCSQWEEKYKNPFFKNETETNKFSLTLNVLFNIQPINFRMRKWIIKELTRNWDVYFKFNHLKVENI